jgi:hypothetical protein
MKRKIASIVIILVIIVGAAWTNRINILLQIPRVKAYVFVFNFFQKFEDGVTSNLGTVAMEITRATLISAVVFLFCSVVIILLVSVVNHQG